MQLVILGMHRSGTSGVTRLLNMAGAYFGPPGIATDANEENPKGFWERRDVRARATGSSREPDSTGSDSAASSRPPSPMIYVRSRQKPLLMS